jgi:uncharacterized DUF497 family protein
MRIEFDPAKRQATLTARGLDMANAGQVFGSAPVTVEDDRPGYSETRFITFGWLNGRLVVIVWTPRGAARRIISMRKDNAKEQAYYGPRLR